MPKLMMLLVALAVASAQPRCPGVSPDFAEHIGHAMHSITLEDLRAFNPNTPIANGVPTVNMNLTATPAVLAHAPSVEMPSAFATEAFNLVDFVLSHMDKGDDGLGPNWLPQERLVHMFHMKDLWARIHKVYSEEELATSVDEETCACLAKTESNGIEERLTWIHDRYAVDTPISLHDWGTQIPKLTSGDTWAEWRKRFSYYYTEEGDRDPAVYLACALAKF